MMVTRAGEVAAGPAGAPPPPSPAAGSPSPAPPSPPSLMVRAASAVALVLLSALLVVAAGSEEPPVEARLGGGVELIELIRFEEARVEALNARMEELARQVAEHQQRRLPDQDAAASLRAQLEEVGAVAGMTSVHGPGLVATLNDSTLEPAEGDDLNSYVIHEQDLQGVINALWAGGAEAMAVNGQRILATTAIRCVGNTLLLHGGVYSPPYVVAAVGDPVTLRSALDNDAAVRRFTRAVDEYGLGWTVETFERLELPAYTGSVTLQVAESVGEGTPG